MLGRGKVKSVADDDDWIKRSCTCEFLEIATEVCPTCKAYLRGVLAERVRLVKQFPKSIAMLPGMIVVSIRKYREYTKRIST